MTSLFRYSVDVTFDKKVVNKESLKDGAQRRKTRGHVKQVLEERYYSKVT